MSINTETFFHPHLMPRPVGVEAFVSHELRQRPVAQVDAGERLVADFRGVSAVFVDGVVVDSWRSDDRSLMGVDVSGSLAFFVMDFTEGVLAYDLARRAWVDEDVDFPRFTFDDDGQQAVCWVRDLETGRRYAIDLASMGSNPSRLTA
ncbi:MAG: hypothetical protein AAFV53_25720 [Myxococcota bacterium]